MRSTASAPWISCCFELLCERTAQATVETAVAFPVFLTLMLIALQPACLLYTRSVMESAASETARIMVTAEGQSDLSYRAFARRRLEAVPDLDIFHTGGAYDWDIKLTRATETGSQVSVTITGAVRPLPVIGVFASAMGSTNEDGDVVLEVTVSYEGRPGWLEGDYESWISIWEEKDDEEDDKKGSGDKDKGSGGTGSSGNKGSGNKGSGGSKKPKR